MSYEIETLMSVQTAIESRSNYGTNLSGSVVYTDLKIVEGTKMARSKDALANNVTKQRVDAWEKKVIGRRRCKADVKMFLNGTNVALDNASTPTPNGLVTMTQCVMGGTWTHTGSTVKSTTVSNTSSSFSVETGQGSRFLPGQVIGMTHPTTGRYETCPIFAVNTDAVTMSVGFSFVPTSGSTVYNSHTQFLTQDPTGSIQLSARGVTSVDDWILCGMQAAGMTFDTTFGGLPAITLNLEGAFWTSGNLGAGYLLNQSITDASPPAFSDSEILFFPQSSSGSVSRSNVPMKDVKLTSNVKYQDIMGASGENIIAKRRSRNIPAMKADITPYFENGLTYWQARDAQTSYSLMIQVGNTPGQTVCIFLPQVQITAIDRGDNDNIVGQPLTVEAQDNRVGTAGSGQNALQLWESPLKIALL